MLIRPLLDRVLHPDAATTIGMVLRFGLSGVAAALTLMFVLWFLTEVVGIWYVYSVVAASLAGFFVSFLLQRRWTFGRRGQAGAAVQLAAFVTLFAANSAINAGLLYLLVDFAGAPYLVAELFLMVAIAIWNFFIMRYLIFREGRHAA